MQHTEAHESAGTDSFLDVTTNIVGILIILVLVVSIRAQNPIVQASTERATEEKVTTLQRQAAEADYDVRRIAEQMESVQREIDVRSKEREVLATLVSAAEKEL